ncbi:hypothetical protein AGMMS49965_22580 [Bacteroidia bacterium]|nr:hypothetical protein AGMMS49965_22580 [Bacteroidia bacterium]
MQQNVRDNGFTELKEVDAKTLNLGTAQRHYPTVTYIDFKKFHWSIIMNELTPEEREAFITFFENPKLYRMNKYEVPFPRSSYDDQKLKNLVNAAVGYSYSEEYSPGDEYKRIGQKIVAEGKSKSLEFLMINGLKPIKWSNDGGYCEGEILKADLNIPSGYDVTVDHFKDAYFLPNNNSVMLGADGKPACKGLLATIYEMLDVGKDGAKDVALWWIKDKDANTDLKGRFCIKRRKEGKKGNAVWWDSDKDKIQITAADLDLPCDTPKDIAELFFTFDSLIKSRKRATKKTTIIEIIKKKFAEHLSGPKIGKKVLIDDRLNGSIPHLYSYMDTSTQIEGQYLSDKENSQILKAIHEHNNIVVAPCGIGKSTSLLYIVRSLKGRNKLVVFVPTQILAKQTVNTFRADGIRSEYVTTGETQWFKEACNQSQVLIFTYGSRIAEEVITNYCGGDSIIAFDECHTTNWFGAYDGIFRVVKGLNFKTIQLTATPLFGVEACAIKELRFSKNSRFKPTIDKVYISKQVVKVDSKDLVKHIKKWYGMENRGRRLVIYVNNKHVIYGCITMLQKELPEAKNMGFFTIELDDDYNDGVNTTGKERKDNILDKLKEFEQGKGDIDILFTTQKGAEGHNFLHNDNDDCYIFVNDWNTSVQFAGRFRDGLRTLTLIGDFGGGGIKTPTYTARYVAEGLTFAERQGKERAASNLLIRKRGMVRLPYELRQIYNINEIKYAEGLFEIAPKVKQLTLLQIVTGDMQDVMLDGLRKNIKDEILANFANLCIPYDIERGVLSNLKQLYARVASTDSVMVLTKNLQLPGLLNHFEVPYTDTYRSVGGDICTVSTKGKRWNKPYPRNFVDFIKNGGAGASLQSQYKKGKLRVEDIHKLYEAHLTEHSAGGAFVSTSLYTIHEYKNTPSTTSPNTYTNPRPPQTMITSPPPPPPLPTIKVIKEPQHHTAANLLAGGYYGEVEAELYAKGLIPEEDFKDVLTGEPCPF